MVNNTPASRTICISTSDAVVETMSERLRAISALGMHPSALDAPAPPPRPDLDEMRDRLARQARAEQRAITPPPRKQKSKNPSLRAGEVSDQFRRAALRGNNNRRKKTEQPPARVPLFRSTKKKGGGQ